MQLQLNVETTQRFGYRLLFLPYPVKELIGIIVLFVLLKKIKYYSL